MVVAQGTHEGAVGALLVEATAGTPGRLVRRPPDPTTNERRQWHQYAFDPSERPVVGLRSREWTAVGSSELEVVVEMARCLREIGAGCVPQ